ncbi:putative general RNA polymerase II transcription factor [Kockovaella imperatae]|uniref:Putative general RNA polymerase II transcription factor n=1 Tax=Kockovaella imperatae TaxID=4999 RepID=A0A1Y1UVJ0_9TREE|nr:putative general RNA polymerase II transcription factor [Kockovaella imperatae]ORX41245.1 putative general RNA polymerase II transcription factor [Kockovaella imperatae]
MSSSFWSSSHCRYWLVTRSHLLAARSLDSQYATPRQLYCLGIWFANLIQKLGKKLNLRQIPIATATVLFRRFYLKNHYCETNPYLVIAACLFVAAKVEETPVHIKVVVNDAKIVFTENGIRMFSPEPTKVGEMEFYLLEDLDFHLVVFHPYRSLLHICGREPADSGKFAKSRVEEDAEIKRKETEARRKHEDARKVSLGVGRMNAMIDDVSGGEWEESEEKRIRRLMGRGSGEGLMDIDEGVVQMCLFVINDTYRTDVHLLYPPYVISLAVLYIGFCFVAKNNPTGTRTTRGSSFQVTNLASSTDINAALGLDAPPTGVAEFFASFEVSLPILFACIQDIIVLYPIWEAFEPMSRGADAKAEKDKDSFTSDDAEALVRRMIEARAVALTHPDTSSYQLAGSKRRRP